MATEGKKKKKKGKTVALNEFLGEEPSGAFVSFSTSHTSNWAEESEDINPDLSSNPWSDAADSRSTRHQAAMDRSMLPTAPRAAREQAALDMNRLPKEPPFTAFIGNLPYDCENSDIEMFFEKEKLAVKSVRLPKDVSGRLKGFGYAEFENVAALVEALSLNNQLLKSRKVRVDIAGSTQGGGDRDRSDRADYSSGEWRRGEDPPPDTRRLRRGDSGDDYQRGRDRRYDGDEYGRGRDRRYDFDDYGRGRERRHESDDYGGRDRRYQEDGDGYGRGRDRRYGSGEGYDRGDRDGRDYNRDDGRRSWRRDDERDRTTSGDRFERKEAPRERPRLQLMPRSVSNEGTDVSPSLSSPNQASIFGSAKPVDTAAKERQIEERLRHEEERKKPQEEERKKQEEEDKTKKQTSVFGAAKPVDTAVREREIEERLRQKEEAKLEGDERKDGDKGKRRPEGRGLGPAWRSERDRERDRGRRGRGRDDGRRDDTRGDRRDERRDDRREEQKDERPAGERQGVSGEKDGKGYEEPQQEFSMPSKFSALCVDDDDDQLADADQSPDKSQ